MKIETQIELSQEGLRQAIIGLLEKKFPKLVVARKDIQFKHKEDRDGEYFSAVVENLKVEHLQ